LLEANDFFLENLNQYLHYKQVILPTLNSHQLRTKFWKNNISSSIEIIPLPLALFLVDPKFHETKRGVFYEPRQNRNRSFTGTHYGKCKIGDLIADVKCQGTPLVGDHKWPYSLGGDTTPDNLLKLCPECNRQKSSSVVFYPWDTEELPNWICEMLNRLRSVKI
jgi:hypothetical protein